MRFSLCSESQIETRDIETVGLRVIKNQLHRRITNTRMIRFVVKFVFYYFYDTLFDYGMVDDVKSFYAYFSRSNHCNFVQCGKKKNTKTIKIHAITLLDSTVEKNINGLRFV